MAKKTQTWVGAGMALVGLALSLYGIALLGFQGFLYLNEGVWPKLPASYVFLEPDLPSNDQQLAEYLREKGFSEPLTEQSKGAVKAEVKSVVITQHALQFVPDWLRSETSWLARPSSWYGMHEMIISTLRFLSVPALSVAFGLIVSLVGLDRIVTAEE